MNMSDNPHWPFPNSFSSLWRLSSRITIATVGLIGKLFFGLFNTVEVYNRETLVNAIDKRPAHVPLLTVANHTSCCDDPGLWSILPYYHFHPDVIRWSITAHDVCFTNTLHSQFFARGNCVPIVRGGGVYQQGIDFCINLMNKGRWVHIFPEGRVNVDKSFIRFKWGVGRLILESKERPIIIPMWHCGMDDVLPNVEPYRPRWGNFVLLNIGQPIDLSELYDSKHFLEANDTAKRKLITDKIQNELMILKEQTECLYSKLKPKL